MPEITRRRRGELIRGVFSILNNNPDGLQVTNVLQQLETLVPPTDFEQSTYPKQPDTRRYEKIVRFSTIGPVKAGWLVKDRGLWSLTDEGTKALSLFSDPEELAKESDKLYRQWEQSKPESAPEQIDEESPGTATTLEEAEEQAWSEIQEYLEQINPYDFQNLVAGLLRGMGYHIAYISPPGPDKGLDVIAHNDPLGIQNPRIKVQVKRRTDKVNVDGIRSFMALLATGDVGIFINMGGFTKDAEQEARLQESRKITLIDIKHFFDLWVEHYRNIPEENRRLLALKPIYFLIPAK